MEATRPLAKAGFAWTFATQLLRVAIQVNLQSFRVNLSQASCCAV
jgi:hypothetical protein